METYFHFPFWYNSGIISRNYTSLASITFLLIKRIFSPHLTPSLLTYFSLAGPGPGLCDGHHRGDGEAVQDVEQPGGGHQQAACGQHSGNHRGGVSQVGPGHFCYISLFHFYYISFRTVLEDSKNFVWEENQIHWM